jgi:transposase-like protein
MIKKASPKGKKGSPNQVFDYGEFEQEAIAGLQSGKGLVGTEGVLTSLIQRIVNAALQGEMSGHLREEQLEGHVNRRNGKLPKQLDTELGEITIETPRDRLGKFEPQLVGKWQRQLGTGLDKQILLMYAKGHSYSDIQYQLKTLYGLDYSTASLSEVTEQVWSEVLAWQQRALQAFYSVIFLDGIYFKTREGGKSTTKVIYSVYAVDSEGRRDVLGVYIRESEGANDWGLILEDLRRRGVEDVLFFCVDGLKGFSDAILSVFPQSIVQRCIVHMVRSSTRFVSDKHIRAVCAGLKAIYTSADVTGAEVALSAFKEQWHKQYPDIAKSWEKDWTELVGFLDYTENLRRMIYTTNAVEALHRQIRKVTKTKGSWVNDKALLKQIFLTLQYSDGWSKKVFNWKSIASDLKDKFGERFEKHVW